MTWVVLMVAAAATPVRLEPATLTLGAPTAALEVVAPGASAVKLECSVCGDGAISAAEPAGEGRFRARFTFPSERFPRVVLLSVETTSGGQKSASWVALPLLANASLKLETKPRASVTVSIGERRFGPMSADATGKLTLPVVVPPGFPAATVVASDRAGNITTTSLDLSPRPFPRGAARLGKGVLADQRVTLDLFAVEADGAPLRDGAQLKVTAQLGTVEAVTARGGGGFSVGYRAPRLLTGQPDQVSVVVDGAPAAVLAVPLGASSPAMIELVLAPPEFTAGSGTKVTVTTRVTDAHGNVAAGVVPTLSSDFGALTEVQLTVPDDFAGRKEVRISAAAPGISGEARLTLRAGVPVSAELKVPGQVAAGRQLKGKLSVKDAFGNPAGADAVTVVGGNGKLGTVTAAADGAELEVGYQTEPGEALGPQALQVRAGERTLTQHELTVFPHQRDWALSAGAFVSGSSNFTQARALSPRVAFAVRLAGLPLELGVEGAFAWFPRLSQARTVDGLNTVDLDMTAWSAALLLRSSVQVAMHWSLQLTLTAGAQHTQSTFSAPGLTTLTTSTWGPLLRGAGGVALHALGGRVLLQLEYGYAPLGEGNVRGNAAGAGVALGYLVGF